MFPTALADSLILGILAGQSLLRPQEAADRQMKSSVLGILAVGSGMLVGGPWFVRGAAVLYLLTAVRLAAVVLNRRPMAGALAAYEWRTLAWGLAPGIGFFVGFLSAGLAGVPDPSVFVRIQGIFLAIVSARRIRAPGVAGGAVGLALAAVSSILALTAGQPPTDAVLGAVTVGAACISVLGVAEVRDRVFLSQREALYLVLASVGVAFGGLVIALVLVAFQL